MKVKLFSCLVLGVGMSFVASNAMAFFSSGPNGQTGNNTQAEMVTKLTDCPVGSVGHETDTNTDCVNTFALELHDDATQLSDIRHFDGAAVCEIVDESISAVDNNCMEEDASWTTVSEDNVVGLKKAFKLSWKPVGASNWSWIIKKIQSRTFARLDQYCASNGSISSIVAWLSGPAKRRVCNSSTAYGYCDATFSTTYMPECNADCREIDDAICDRGGVSPCNLEADTVTCPSSYDDIASYCSTSHGSCDQTACQALVSGVCNLFPAERFTDLTE